MTVSYTLLKRVFQMSRPRSNRALCWPARLLVCLAAFSAFNALAQEAGLLSIQQDEQSLLIMPRISEESQLQSSGGTQFSIEIRDKIFRYKAVSGDSIVYSNWMGATRDLPWLAYLPASGKFQEVTNRVVVTLKDGGQLDVIAKELNALRFKHYDLMGYSVLWFDKNQNPAQVVSQLKSDERVASAKLQFSERRRFPW